MKLVKTKAENLRQVNKGILTVFATYPSKASYDMFGHEPELYLVGTNVKNAIWDWIPSYNDYNKLKI